VWLFEALYGERASSGNERKSARAENKKGELCSGFKLNRAEVSRRGGTSIL
jgi:hypothetical protein